MAKTGGGPQSRGPRVKPRRPRFDPRPLPTPKRWLKKSKNITAGAALLILHLRWSWLGHAEE
jgi:hypothetical protein